MASQTPPQNPKEHLQQMNILYLALLGGQVMIAVTLLLVAAPSPVESDSAMTTFGGMNTMMLVGMLVFLGAAGASFFMYNKRKAEGVQLKGTLMEKLDHYRASFIMRVAFLEGANLLLIVLYFFQNGGIGLMVLFTIGLALFVIARPSADRIIQDYQLSGSEQSELKHSQF